ncbi:hypothetical protein L4C38_20125 [Vibrio kasasachensis]|uniref:alginate O-acetyltransferase AlgX-related protein n=1 Tax=Vibrio kasasachensis TaxID=2910248 RepID=UPI003D10083D
MKTNIFTLLFILFSGSVAATPNYTISPVLELCKATQSQTNFTSEDTKYMYPLILNDDGWMIGGNRELSTEFTPESIANFKRFIQTVEKRLNATVVIALAPPRTLEGDKWKNGEFSSKQALQAHYDNILTMYRSAGLHVPDLSRNMDTVKPSYYFKRDIHWRPEGASHAANTIAKYLDDNGLVDHIPQIEAGFLTTNKGNRQLNRSTFNTTLKTLCGYSFIDESTTIYETTPSVEEDLFSSNDPEIYMIGTSFSKVETFHFEGFLKQSLQRHVANLALSGGGEFGAWLELFENLDDDTSSHKIIIWELLSYYNPSKYANLQHLIPMVNNGCKSADPLTVFSGSLQNGQKKELIFDPKLFDYYPSQLIVDLDTGVFDTTSLKLRVWFDSGKKINLNLNATRNRHKDGRYVFELGDINTDKLGKVLAIDVIDSSAKSGEISQIEGSVCLSNEWDA